MAFTSIAAQTDPIRVREDRAIFRALRIVEQRAAERGPLLSDPITAGSLFRLRLGNEPREHFEAAFLDNKHRLLAVERLFSGTVDDSAIYPRVVVQRALAVNAAAVIVAHNHPSGDPTPSVADNTITCQLSMALDLVGVRLLDHLVVSAGSMCSVQQWRSDRLHAPSRVPETPARPKVPRRAANK